MQCNRHCKITWGSVSPPQSGRSVRAWFVVGVLLLAGRVTSYATMRKPTDPPLVQAIKAGDAKRVAALLALGNDPNITDRSGCPAILCIVYAPVTLRIYGDGHKGSTTITRHKNHRSIVQLMVISGAKVNVKSSQGWTPLLQAQAGGEWELMAFLKKSRGEDLSGEK